MLRVKQQASSSTQISSFFSRLLPNAEYRENQIQDVVGRGCSGNFVERAGALKFANLNFELHQHAL